MDWISLFQNREESAQMEQSEFAQYSCTKLLRQIEVAAESNSKMEESGGVDAME
jgi:hypothetical protein